MQQFLMQALQAGRPHAHWHTQTHMAYTDAAGDRIQTSLKCKCAIGKERPCTGIGQCGQTLGHSTPFTLLQRRADKTS